MKITISLNDEHVDTFSADARATTIRWVPIRLFFGLITRWVEVEIAPGKVKRWL